MNGEQEAYLYLFGLVTTGLISMSQKEHGSELFRLTRKNDLEGIVAKRSSGVFDADARGGPQGIKIKTCIFPARRTRGIVRRVGDVVVPGVTISAGHLGG